MPLREKALPQLMLICLWLAGCWPWGTVRSLCYCPHIRKKIRGLRNGCLVNIAGSNQLSWHHQNHLKFQPSHFFSGGEVLNWPPAMHRPGPEMPYMRGLTILFLGIRPPLVYKNLPNVKYTGESWLTGMFTTGAGRLDSPLCSSLESRAGHTLF